MKKILSIIFSIALALTIVSCDMDKKPFGSIDPDNALQTIADAQKLRNTVYRNLRTLFSGSYIYGSEIQTDLFHASISFGNRGGSLYQWDFSTGFDYASSFWSNYYVGINNANYLIQEIEKVDYDAFSEEDQKLLDLYKGEAYFARAFYLQRLLEKFSAAYDPSTASSALGVPIILKYEPTSNDTKYPARSTMQECYDQINSDLAEATRLITTAPKLANIYLTSDAVKAFKARVALYTQKWDDAINFATQVIDSGLYPLVSDLEDFEDMWLNDTGDESIIQYFAAYPDEVPSSNSYSFTSYSLTTKLYTPDYIPETWVIDLYDEDDIRYAAHYIKVEVDYGQASGTVEISNKYPGNPALRNGDQSTWVHAIKPFRVAELYLIVAEAYARKGDNSNGSKYLNDLRESRIPEYIATGYVGNALLTEIKEERVRELFAEGFRFYDLKRYNEGMQRSNPQVNSVVYMPGGATTTNLSKTASDFRFLWPIPQTEIDANPQIKNQQNSGY